MIVKTIDEQDFREEFRKYGRGEQFSYEGLEALYEWLEDMADETGVPYELDVIALCCEFTEYESFDEVKEVYEDTINDMDDLYNHTHVIEFDGGLIIADF